MNSTARTAPALSTPRRFARRPRLPIALALAATLLAALPSAAYAGPSNVADWAREVSADIASVASPEPAEAAASPDPAATIVGLKVDRDAFSPNGDGRADTIRIGFSSTVAQHLRIAVVDATGALVHVIVDADIVPGPAIYEWNGTSTDGAPVADGSYQLVFDAGVAPGNEHQSEVVVVDRAAPTLTEAPSRVSLTSQFARSFELPVTLSEPAVIDVAASGRAGRVHAVSTEVEGRIKLAVPVINRAPLRRILAKRPVPVRASIVATDAAGNRAVRRMPVTMDYEAADVRGTITPPPVPRSQLGWPVSAPITSRFGPRWGRLHAGIDFSARIGTPIGAAASGRVVSAGWMGGYGNAVVIDHGGGLETLYGHQSQIVTHAGANVQRGQLIGYTGNTGNSTGPHLHFEAHVGGTPRDPLAFLP